MAPPKDPEKRARWLQNLRKAKDPATLIYNGLQLD